MGYLKSEFKLHMFGLGHDKISNFYLGCFQKGQSVLPLLFIRIVIFLTCLATIVISLVSPPETDTQLRYWLIYMTNWGVVLITITSGFAVIVSGIALFKVPFDSTLKLPWYVKIYWVLFVTTVPVSVFITAFYYIMLFDSEGLTTGTPYDLAQDFLTHAVNSVLMLLLLITSRTPFRILHFYFPVGIGLVYLIFSAIYYAADGVNQNGDPYIYEVLDWSDPGGTMILVLICVVVTLAIHLLIAGLTALRNALTKRCTDDDETSYFLNGDPYIYEVLDWSDPGGTMILVLICVVVTLAIHLLIAGLTALRNALTKRCTDDDETSYFL